MYKNEDDDSEIMPIVIDNGSGIIKAGFAGDELPQIEYSNAVAIPKYPNWMYGNNSNENYYIGEELQRMKSVWKIKYPVRRGFIEDWDSMKIILKYTFNRLSNYSLYKRAWWYTSIDNPVMITESSVHSKRDREEMWRMMFEYFDIPAIY